MSAYNDKNVFIQIIKKELPCNEVENNENSLSFEDINKQAPVHVLTIPKGKYTNLESFASNASNEEIASFIKTIVKSAKNKDLLSSGYRVIINSGSDGNQEVPHLHAHVLGGKNLGPMIKK